MDFLMTTWVYLLVGFIFIYILAQSSFFLVKAYRQAKKLGFTSIELRKTIYSSVVFSIAPSIAILIGLVTLSKIFGPMIAGMRLGTLGAVTYELPTAILVLNRFGFSPGDILTKEVIVTALWVMTFGCIPPLLIIPLFYKKMSGKLQEIKKKDSNWSKIMMDALFIGMISAFVGFILAKKTPEVGDPYFSWLSLMVFLTSAILIVIFGIMIKKLKWEWLKNYALPFSMIFSMLMAIVYFGMGVR
jgi:hypothetical protein